MGLLSSLFEELVTILTTVFLAIPYVAGYIGFILATLFVWRLVKTSLAPKSDFGSLKTVTFGDESAVTSNFLASIVSILMIFLIWGSFTGSSTLPSFIHMPGAFEGDANFTYTVENQSRERDDADVYVIVHGTGVKVTLPEIEPGSGFAKNDVLAVKAYRTKLLKWDANDSETRKDGAKIVAVNGQPIVFGTDVDAGDLKIAPT